MPTLPSSPQVAARSRIHAVGKGLDGDARAPAVAHEMDYSGRRPDSGACTRMRETPDIQHQRLRTLLLGTLTPPFFSGSSIGLEGSPLGLVIRCIVEVKREYYTVECLFTSKVNHMAR